MASREQIALERLLATQETAVRRAFQVFLADARADWVIAEVRGLIERGQLNDALNVANTFVARLGDVFPRVFIAAGYESMAHLAEQFGQSRVAVSFDPTYPRAAALMRNNKLQFVTGFTNQQRQASQAALVSALDKGQGSLAAARAIRDSIGLTSYQWNAVQNYRRAVEAGSAAALTRELRDRRYDGTLQRAIDDGDLLNNTQIDRMVGRYTSNMLAMRAESIARTETQRVLNQARQEAVQQSMEQTGIDPAKVTRTWNATQDARTRDTHSEMDGQQRGLNEPFDSSSGAQMMFPGDPSLGAPPEELINCRCVLTIDVGQSDRSGDDQEAA